MKVADAHCDTLTKFDNPFHSDVAMWNLGNFKKANGILQFMAVFTPPEYEGDSALRFALNSLGSFHRNKTEEIQHLDKKENFNPEKVNILLTLEGASPLINNINNLYAFYDLGVRLITLTWNHRNFVADGVGEESNYGLTNFGKEVVATMENLGMIVDVSHLNEAGFYHLCDIATQPFMASHSNANAISPHIRNLKDDQIKEIVNRQGFIGLNFYSKFIDESSDRDVLIDKFLKHVSYFLDMGCENILGLGADFDGIDESPFVNVLAYLEIAELLSEKLNLSDSLIERIMYKNLVDFTLKIIH